MLFDFSPCVLLPYLPYCVHGDQQGTMFYICIVCSFGYDRILIYLLIPLMKVSQGDFLIIHGDQRGSGLRPRKNFFLYPPLTPLKLTGYVYWLIPIVLQVLSLILDLMLFIFLFLFLCFNPYLCWCLIVRVCSNIIRWEAECLISVLFWLYIYISDCFISMCLIS